MLAGPLAQSMLVLKQNQRKLFRGSFNADRLAAHLGSTFRNDCAFRLLNNPKIVQAQASASITRYIAGCFRFFTFTQ